MLSVIYQLSVVSAVCDALRLPLLRKVKPQLSILRISPLLLSALLFPPLSHSPLSLTSPQATHVYIDGVFDMMHEGHFIFTKRAAAFGDKLVVGLGSDEVCAGYKRPPIMTEAERRRALLCLPWVSTIVYPTAFNEVDAAFLRAKCAPPIHLLRLEPSPRLATLGRPCALTYLPRLGRSAACSSSRWWRPLLVPCRLSTPC